MLILAANTASNKKLAYQSEKKMMSLLVFVVIRTTNALVFEMCFPYYQVLFVMVYYHAVYIVHLYQLFPVFTTRSSEMKQINIINLQL